MQEICALKVQQARHVVGIILWGEKNARHFCPAIATCETSLPRKCDMRDISAPQVRSETSRPRKWHSKPKPDRNVETLESSRWRATCKRQGEQKANLKGASPGVRKLGASSRSFSQSCGKRTMTIRDISAPQVQHARHASLPQCVWSNVIDWLGLWVPLRCHSSMMDAEVLSTADAKKICPKKAHKQQVWARVKYYIYRNSALRSTLNTLSLDLEYFY